MLKSTLDHLLNPGLSADLDDKQEQLADSGELEAQGLYEAQDLQESHDSPSLDIQQVDLSQLIEGILLAAGKPLTEADILQVFEESERPALGDLRQALYTIQEACGPRGFDLVQVASGYQFVVKPMFAKWVGKLFAERPQKYTRALLETLALVAYRQPITRGEIEDIRGVAVSTYTFRTLDERGWVRIVGHKDVPGKPALYATTKSFLDYFGLKSLDELPPLPEIMQMDVMQKLEQGVEAEFAPLPVDEAEVTDSADLDVVDSAVADADVGCHLDEDVTAVELSPCSEDEDVIPVELPS